jgi:hypothetical protein
MSTLLSGRSSHRDPGFEVNTPVFSGEPTSSGRRVRLARSDDGGLGCSATPETAPVPAAEVRRWTGVVSQAEGRDAVDAAQALDDEMTDRDLREEIALLGEVIAATTGCPGHLSTAEVDRALGVGPVAG